MEAMKVSEATRLHNIGALLQYAADVTGHAAAFDLAARLDRVGYYLKLAATAIEQNCALVVQTKRTVSEEQPERYIDASLVSVFAECMREATRMRSFGLADRFKRMIAVIEEDSRVSIFTPKLLSLLPEVPKAA
jgi:hypothetical protein